MYVFKRTLKGHNGQGSNPDIFLYNVRHRLDRKCVNYIMEIISASFSYYSSVCGSAYSVEIEYKKQKIRNNPQYLLPFPEYFLFFLHSPACGFIETLLHLRFCLKVVFWLKAASQKIQQTYSSN